METYDQYRVRVIRGKIESLKKEISDWEIALGKTTGRASRLPRPDEALKRVREDIEACNDNLERLEIIEEKLIGDNVPTNSG